MKRIRFRLDALKTLALGFALIILLGAGLLMLPASNRSGQSIPFVDALFTATSATCVTGLIVYDTYTQFTHLGQIVIIVLIQTGGLGFMMVAVMFSLVLGKRIGLKERSLLMESVSSMQLGGVVRFARRILFGTALVEGIGAILLSFRFVPMFGFAQGMWNAIFHAISAFCNAGFDLMGRFAPFSSLTSFAGDALVSLTIMALIVIGGIGFIAWDDLANKRFRFKEYRLHTKLSLLATAVLIVVPYLLFLWTEGDGLFAGVPAGQKHLSALFASVTPRTAGFNTIDVGAMSEPGAFLTMLLMLVGASPGSTAGGIKITTAAVLVLSAVAYARRSDDINLFGRRLEAGLVRRASSAVTMYVLAAGAGCFILMTQQPIPLTDALFESLSAIGTVGMSRGITPELPVLSKAVIALLMYIGRVGSLSVAMALVERGRVEGLRKPVEKIIIG